jgi:hypothetical protein
MAAWTSFWRRAGGVFIACLLVMLVIAPSADSFMCADDGPQTASVEQSFDAGAANLSPAGSIHKDVQHGICPHGHCHHGIPYVGAASLAAIEPHAFADRPQPPEMTNHPSGPASRLEDPPRA